MYHGQSDEVIPYASAVETAHTWCTRGASVNFVSETGGTGHVGTAAVLLGNATNWLDLRLDGIAAAKGCHNVSYAATGSPQKRSAFGAAIEKYGVGDERIIADIQQKRAEGQPVPSLWSYLSSA